jgi:hypothetical protein
MAADAGFDSREVLELMAGTREREEVGLRNVYLISGTDLDTVARFRPGSVFWYDADDGFPLGPYTVPTPGTELLWDISGDSLVVVVDAVRGRVRWLLAASDGLEQIAERDLRLPERPLELLFLDSLAAAKRRDGVRRVGFIRPTHNPYFGRALLDDRGAVWLRRNPEGNSNAQDSTTYLVVAMAGQEPFDATLPPSFTPAAITSTLVVGVYRNELDVEFVDIYRWSGR